MESAASAPDSPISTPSFSPPFPPSSESEPWLAASLSELSELSDSDRDLDRENFPLLRRVLFGRVCFSLDLDLLLISLDLDLLFLLIIGLLPDFLDVEMLLLLVFEGLRFLRLDMLLLLLD